MEIGRTLHRSGIASAWTFDVHEDTKKMLALLDERHRTSFPDFDQLYDLAERLNDLVKCAPENMVLCHNDFYEPNFLVQKDRMHLIDWEYSGMSDYASDLAVYICCSDYTYDEALHVLELYFQRPLTAEAVPLHRVPVGGQLPLVRVGALQGRLWHARGRVSVPLVQVHEVIRREGAGTARGTARLGDETGPGHRRKSVRDEMRRDGTVDEVRIGSSAHLGARHGDPQHGACVFHVLLHGTGHRACGVHQHVSA